MSLLPNTGLEPKGFPTIIWLCGTSLMQSREGRLTLACDWVSTLVCGMSSDVVVKGGFEQHGCKAICHLLPQMGGASLPLLFYHFLRRTFPMHVSHFLFWSVEDLVAFEDLGAVLGTWGFVEYIYHSGVSRFCSPFSVLCFASLSCKRASAYYNCQKVGVEMLTTGWWQPASDWACCFSEDGATGSS